MAKNRVLLACAAVTLGLSLLILFVWWTRSSSASPASAVINGTTPSNLLLPTVEVTRGRIEKSLLLDGELRAVQFRTVFASTSEEAKITFLPPEGTVVKPGDRLVELDSTTILNRIKELEERLVAAENEIIRASSTNEAALRDLEVEASRFWMAHEQASIKADIPEGLLPRREFQERQLAREKAKTEYQSHLAKIEQKKKEHAADLSLKLAEKAKLEVQLNKARNNLKGMTLAAPTDGMVIYADHWFERRKIQVGDVVWGGFPLVRLPDLKEMEVVSQINEVDGPKISIGQKARIVLDSYPDIVIDGSVQDIAQTAIKAGWLAKAKIFKVTVSMEKTLPEIMKPGMSAQVFVVVREIEDQLLVPRSAVRFDAGTPRVLKIDGEERHEVAVTTVSSDSTSYAVADNGALKTGDRIASRW
jgi:multidrug efflux pump subunit AcrA (membrane-fusion protein)